MIKEEYKIDRVKGATPPLCKDCKFLTVGRTYQRCTKIITIEDLVTGVGTMYAATARKYYCGAEGKFWEKREPKIGFWKRIKNYFSEIFKKFSKNFLCVFLI